MRYPQNLGEGKHLLTPENELHFLRGQCFSALGDGRDAAAWYRRAAEPQGDPDAPAGDGPYWQALALRALGEPVLADERLVALAEAAAAQAADEVRIPYFATSLPTLLLFDDDLSERAHQEARYLAGLALLGQGRRTAAAGRFRRLLQVRPDHLDARLRLADISRRA
jgi:tetratricopeptide (TPR) repeat protein